MCHTQISTFHTVMLNLPEPRVYKLTWKRFQHTKILSHFYKTEKIVFLFLTGETEPKRGRGLSRFLQKIIQRFSNHPLWVLGWIIPRWPLFFQCQLLLLYPPIWHTIKRSICIRSERSSTRYTAKEADVEGSCSPDPEGKKKDFYSVQAVMMLATGP